jgi:two-component system sensor histidine kinase RegB
MRSDSAPLVLRDPAGHLNLNRVLGIRLVMLTVCLVALVAAQQSLNLRLPLDLLVPFLLLAFIATIGYWLWLRPRPERSTPSTMAAQLLLDIVILSVIVYLTGGWTNPLVSLYLVPIAAAAALLSRTWTWIVTGAAVLAYGAMTRFHKPIFDLHHGGADFALHVSGMWLTFVLAAMLLAYFGSQFAATLQRRDRALAAAREANLRSEQIMGIATLAAGTAHELSTPLATIAVTAAELNASATTEQQADLAELIRQIHVCRDILNRLRASAVPRIEQVSLRTWLHEVIDRFQLLRPAVTLHAELPEPAADRLLDVDPMLQQALLNLLDNAANVSVAAVELLARLEGEALVIDILDRGPGLAAGPSQPDGLGVGLVLANATVERRGGMVLATARSGGGTCIRVQLPLSTGSDLPP